MLPPPSVGIRMESRLYSLALLAALSGCAAVQVQVPVLPPPTLDLSAAPQVAVAPLQGDVDGSVQDLIRSALAMSSRFRVVAPEEAARTSTVVLSGGASVETHEETKSFDLKEGDFSNGERVVHHFLTRTGTGTIRASLQAKESLSGKLLGDHAFEATSVVVKRAAPDMMPGLISPAELINEARTKFAAELVDAVAPPPRLIEVTLFRDGKLPQLENVISQARAGHLEDAAAAATAAVQSAEQAGGEPRLAGLAHWNRGIIEELRGTYDAARQDVQQAANLTQDAQLTAEFQHINELEQQARRTTAPGR